MLGGSSLPTGVRVGRGRERGGVRSRMRETRFCPTCLRRSMTLESVRILPWSTPAREMSREVRFVRGWRREREASFMRPSSESWRSNKWGFFSTRILIQSSLNPTLRVSYVHGEIVREDVRADCMSRKVPSS
jgi:hypothetical protein